MESIISNLFKPTSTYQLNSYRGKHILENYLKRYVPEEEFILIMKQVGHKMNTKNQYKLKENNINTYKRT